MGKIAAIAVLSVSSLTLVAALAQVAEPPATRPAAPTTAPTAVAAEPLLDRLLQNRPGVARPLDPVQAEPSRPNLRKEGEFVRERVGRLSYDPQTQAPLFSFEADSANLQGSPLGILFSQELARMEDAVKKSSLDLRFRISGMITRYRDRNYLLIERADLAPDPLRP